MSARSLTSPAFGPCRDQDSLVRRVSSNGHLIKPEASKGRVHRTANLDGAQLRKVLKAPRAEDEKVEGISFDSFRYFSSLSSQTILACCGFMLHVQDFYVPLVPFGSAEEEAQEEAAEKRRQLREVRFAAA